MRRIEDEMRNPMDEGFERLGEEVQEHDKRIRGLED